MIIASKLEIDLQQPGFKKVAYAVQNDRNTRALEISLFLSGTAWKIPSGTTAAVSFRKMDLTSGLYDTLPDGSTKAVTFSGNTLTAILAPQVLTCAGKVDVSIVLYDSNLNRLSTFPIALYVSADPSAGKMVSNEYHNLQTLLESLGIVNLYVCDEGAYPDNRPAVEKPDENTVYLTPIDYGYAIEYMSWKYADGDWEFIENLTVTFEDTDIDKAELINDVIKALPVYNGEVLAV